MRRTLFVLALLAAACQAPGPTDAVAAPPAAALGGGFTFDLRTRWTIAE